MQEIQFMEVNHNQCIFCKSTTNTFESIEHIFPESLGNKEKFLDKGFVCDDCNHTTLSKLDEELLNFEGIKFMRAIYGIESKKGRIPVCDFFNLKTENPEKGCVRINLQSKKQVRSHGDAGFDLYFKGNRKMDSVRLKLLARALYKIGYELMCLDHGRDFILSPRFNEIRDIILGKKDFSGYIIIGSNEKTENPQMKYYSLKDEHGKEFMVFDFVYLFVRFIFDMERREVLPKAGTKFNLMTVMKF